ncbi:serine/arginine repetitive matrix protein 1 [Episyrphus balteatus]|uniref:serine/arginine repetitive matrix protein 1 n=1 Tax=Episyrphus balteatus TaxID=286459 RepID=UPI002485D696|nr:serine/arginine repetitive matrix protein 1 [Episyrphus balteatus]
MINGKFFTGLPANMVDKRHQTLNRQETHFFWPDDTQNVSSVDSRTKRRTTTNNDQVDNRNGYPPRGDQSNSDAENKERFKKEFTRSSIQFYDNVEDSPVRRNRKKLTVPPNKLQNVEPPANLQAKRKENLTSKIQFGDYSEDLNNAPKPADKNNKAELERNNKNSPKLLNKNLSLDPPDEGLNFIENDVRDMRLSAPPRRRNTSRDSRPRYGPPPLHLPVEDPFYSDIHDDYNPPPRSRPHLPPPSIRSRYSESDPDYDEYIPRRSQPPRSNYFARDSLDYIDGHPSARNNYYDGAVPSRKLGRQQVQSTYSSANEYTSNYGDSPPPPPRLSAQQRMPRKGTNILKVDNDIRNNEQRQMMIPPQPQAATSPPSPSHQHLRSNICFSDTESAASGRPPPPPPPSSTSSVSSKKNIRSSAVNRVSVGLPD